MIDRMEQDIQRELEQASCPEEREFLQATHAYFRAALLEQDKAPLAERAMRAAKAWTRKKQASRGG